MVVTTWMFKVITTQPSQLKGWLPRGYGSMQGSYNPIISTLRDKWTKNYLEPRSRECRNGTVAVVVGTSTGFVPVAY